MINENKYFLTTDGELCHYGVKGMKWGHRKAQELKAKALQARRSGDETAAKKYEEQAKEKLATGKRAEKFDQKYQEIRSKRSFGAKAALLILGGPFANRTYSAVQAAGGSTSKAVATTAVATLLGGPLGHIVASSLIKNTVADGGKF